MKTILVILLLTSMSATAGKLEDHKAKVDEQAVAIYDRDYATASEYCFEHVSSTMAEVLRDNLEPDAVYNTCISTQTTSRIYFRMGRMMLVIEQQADLIYKLKDVVTDQHNQILRLQGHHP